MSDTPPGEPKLNDLLNALNELSWGEVKEVALQLGVAFPTLRQVEGNRSEFIERLQDSMYFWLSSDKVRPTWARLVTALRLSNKATLAETVEQKYCKAVETPPAIQPPQNLSSPHSPPLTESTTLPPPPDSTTTAVSSSVNPPLLPSYTTASFPPPHSTDVTPSHRSTSSPRPKRHVRRTSPPAPPSPSPPPSSPPQSHHPTLEATQPADLPGLQGRSAQPHPAQVRRELSRLQIMFSSVLAHTENFLIKKEKKSDDVLTDLCTYLTTRPLAPGMLLLKEKKKEIENAKSVRAIFSILEIYWNYSNYYLLQALTKEYGDSPLQQEMENYVAELHRFEKTTSVQTFKSVKIDWEHPPKLKKAILTLEKDEAELTLYEIRQLIEDIANEAAIEAYALYLNGICCSAVVLTLAFPHDGLELFASALSPKFLAKHQITSVVIDDLPLEKYTQEYVKGLQLVRVSGEGDKTAATSLLSSGVDPNFRHKDEKCALLCASLNGHSEVVRVLLDCGADIHAVDKWQRSALHWASVGGHHETVQLLLEAKMDVNRPDGDGDTALILAAKGGHTLTVKALIRGGADPNIQDRVWRRSALHWASVGGHHEIVQLLLEAKIDLNRGDEYGDTALILAAREGHTLTVQDLIGAGADPNIQGMWQSSALHWASQRGYHETVQLLLEAKMDANGPDGYGYTALILAAMGGHTLTVKALIVGGADPNIQGWRQRSSLHFASVRGLHDIVQLLLEAKIDVNRQDEDGNTALILAAKGGHTLTVKALIGGGADPNIQDMYGNTAVTYARERGSSDVVHILIQARTNPMDQKELRTSRMPSHFQAIDTSHYEPLKHEEKSLGPVKPQKKWEPQEVGKLEELAESLKLAAKEPQSQESQKTQQLPARQPRKCCIM